MNQLQHYIHVSRYARFLEDENRRETWPETVSRYINFFKERNEAAEIDWDELEQAILNHDVMPSMRAMMTAGKALEKSNIAGYNCAFVAVDDVRVFDEAMYILLNGTGVGFSVERQYVNQLPEVPSEIYETDTTIVVPDSKLGWASSLKQYMSMLYNGLLPEVDYTRIRPAGSRLKTFGGRASGPEPLMELFDYIARKFIKQRRTGKDGHVGLGRKLTSLECHDILCKIGSVVVVGGVRRSALISLSNLSDERMRMAKHGNFGATESQRYLANNSVCYTEKPDIEIFMKEWLALIESKNGERGIYNNEAAKKVSPERRDTTLIAGTNPCAEIILRSGQFCVAPTTPLITGNGIEPISSYVDQEVDVWNGEEWTPVTVRKTGIDQKLMRVSLSDGSYLDCTPDHRWSVKTRFQKNWKEVETKDLLLYSDYSVQVEPANVVASLGGTEIDNAYSLGFAVGDGCVYDGNVLIDCYGDAKINCPVVGNRGTPTLKNGYNVECVRINSTEYIDPETLTSLRTDLSPLSQWSRKSVLEFVAGLADADGAQASNGIRVYLSDEHQARKMQLVLTKNGIKSSCNLHTPKGFVTNYGARSKSLWYVQITECNDIPCHRLDVSKGKPALYKGKYQNIRNVELLEGTHDTYCFNEPKKHKGLFGNVLTYQCNLSEVVVRSGDTLKTLKNKVRLAAILGTLQATLVDFKYLRPIWARNTAEERLLGVSLTGMMDNATLCSTDGHIKSWLQQMRQVAIDTNIDYANRLGIPESAAITCVKPSGTVSLLVNAASGIHPRYSQYYNRTARQDKKDPLAAWMIEKGFPHEEEIRMDGQPSSNWVFSFPVKGTADAVFRDDRTALEQLEHWKVVAENWCEHKPSITVYVRDNEWLHVGAWVYENFDLISGISFLPYDGGNYKQAPYQELTEAGYKELLAQMPKDVKFEDYIEHDDNTTSSQQMACSAGSCEII